MGPPALLRSASVAALLALTACSGGGRSRSAVRTTDGPTSTAVSGSGYDGTGASVAGAAGTGVAGSGSAATGAPGAAGVAGAAGTATAGAPGPTGLSAAGVTGTTGASSTGSSTGAGGGTTAGAPTSSGGTGGGTPAAGTGGTTGGANAGPSPASPGDLAAFCPAERTLESRLRAIDAGAGPGALRASVSAARAAFGPALGSAPAEVKGDVTVITDSAEQLFQALDQAGYDVSKVSVAAVQGLSPSSVQAASAHLATYTAANC